MDISGKVLKTEKRILEKGQNTIKVFDIEKGLNIIQFEGFKKGLNIIHFESNGIIFVRKIIE